MWYWQDGTGGWGLFGMVLGMAVAWLPLLILLVWALRGLGRPSRGSEPPPEPDAREIARRSYARGEIDRERYLQIIADLEQTKG